MKYSNCNKSIEKAKEITAILNHLKVSKRYFATLTELTTVLREHKCPYAPAVVSYLNRQKLIGISNSFWHFLSIKPFDFYNFIQVVERAKSQKRTYSKTLSLRKVQKENTPKPLGVSVTHPIAHFPHIEPQVSKHEFSKWNKFWIKFFFGVNLWGQ